MALQKKKLSRETEVIAIFLTLAINFVLGLFSVSFLGEYGFVVFLLIPFLIGFLPPFICSRKKQLTTEQSYKLSFITLGIALVGLLVFAMEGMICILMASPLFLLLTLMGSHTAFLLQKKQRDASLGNVSVVLAIASIGLMSFDSLNEPKGLIPVKTKVIVEADINSVWNNVVTFSTIDAPVDWIFKTGISYPTDATIEGHGVGAIRYCNFSTGSFVEPITKWDEPHLLQFSVAEQPIPMTEYNPFWDVHPPHLDGYFQSFKGQFKLTELSNNKTELEGTTWYQVDITPQFYWKTWSDFIIHRIHERVLNHIKKESEDLAAS